MKHLDFRRLRHAGAALALLLAAQMGLNAAMAGKGSSRPVASPVLAADDAEVPGEVLVRLRSTADLQPLLIKHSLSLRSQFGLRPIYRL